MRRIVVTGGNGFVGSAVVRALRSADLDVKTCSRRSGVDLRDPSAFGRWLSAMAPDLVVHCAAHVGGIGYVGQHAIDVFHDNLMIAGGLLKGIRTARVDRLVTVLPNCTYPGDKDVYREEEWWDGPIHDSVLMYGLPRKVLWGMCKTYGDATGLCSAHLIFPNMYGPCDHFDPYRSHALGALIRKIVDARDADSATVELWGTGRPVREWMYVEDAANAVLGFMKAVSSDKARMDDHSLYNVGVGTGVSIAELASLIGKAAGWKGTFVYDTARPDGAMRKLLDGERFRAITDWQPAVTLKEGVRRTIKWYEELSQDELTHAYTGV